MGLNKRQKKLMKKFLQIDKPMKIKGQQMSCAFNEDDYRDQQLYKHLDEQDVDAEEEYERYMDALADAADAMRELEREEQE